MSLRLILLAGVAIAFLSLGGVALYWRGNAIAAEAERDKAYADLRVAIEANRTNLDTIAKLRADAERDNQLTADLLAQLDEINKSLEEANHALVDLGKANEDVRAYLDGRVPAELDKLLNRP